MALFEYLAIAFSLLLSFAAMRLVGGLPHAVHGGARYWIHLSFVGFQLLFTVIVFWTFWLLRNVEWDLPTFLLMLTTPGFIYYNACTLVPENPSEVESWHDYYFSVRRRYFIGLSCWVVALIAISTVVLGFPLVHPTRVVQAVALPTALLGAFSSNPRVHAGLVMFLFAVVILFMFSFGLRPGEFTLQ